MSLDELFGPPIPPQGYGGLAYRQWELDHPPQSLSRLSTSNAQPLGEMMETIRKGWSLGEFWVTDTILIWLVDFAGEIWFAVEELVLDALPAGVPKHQHMSLTKGADKLGHPSLVGCQSARIGGEIYFDRTLTPPAWTINNRSGRYGVHPTRTAAQLDEVARRFAAFGITLVTAFI